MKGVGFPYYEARAANSQRQKGNNTMKNTEGLGNGHGMSGAAVELAVYNWAFGQGFTPMNYDWASDTWHMSDGEPYTTTLILREVEGNGSINNTI